MEMTLRNSVDSGISIINVEIPELIANKQGKVCMRSLPGGLIHIDIEATPDEALRQAGITDIKSISRILVGNKGDYASCQTNIGERGILLASRPWLRELIENRDQIKLIIEDARIAFWSKQRAEYAENVEQPLLDAMEAEARALRDKIPSDSIEVKVEHVGDADGFPILRYTANGVELDSQDVTIVGVAGAIRPGALGAFASVTVAQTTADRIQRKLSVNAASQAQRDADKNELLITEIPVSALASYRHYHGNAETAWEAGNESAWAAINHWTPYIEAQGLASVPAVMREMTEAARERPIDQ